MQHLEGRGGGVLQNVEDTMLRNLFWDHSEGNLSLKSSKKEEGLFVRTKLSINSKTLLQIVHAQKKKEVGGSRKK